jgi:putative flippase GtrA
MHYTQSVNDTKNAEGVQFLQTLPQVIKVCPSSWATSRCGVVPNPQLRRAPTLSALLVQLTNRTSRMHSRFIMLPLTLAGFLKQNTDSPFIQLLRYALVGGLAFVVDFGSLYFLTEHLHAYYMHSAALAFVLGLTTNYLLSVTWVFQKRTFNNRLVEYGVFAVLGVLGLGLNQGLIYGLTEYASCHYLFSKALATGLVFLWNFGSRKLLLFHYAPNPRRRRPQVRPCNSDQLAIIVLQTPEAENVSVVSESMETPV